MSQHRSKRKPAAQRQPKPKQKPEDREHLPELGKQREYESIGDGCYRRMPTSRD